jgi:hypothetical protein
MGMIVLAGLKEIEKRCKEERRATLTLVAAGDGPSEKELAASLESRGFKIASFSVLYAEGLRNRELTCEVRWNGRPKDTLPPQFVHELAQRPGVLRLAWRP